MTDNLIKAMELLEGHTCVLYNGTKTYTSAERGITPLLGFIGSNVDFRGYSVADKVVGKGAAMIYAAMGIKEIFADIMSVPAKEVFEKNKIDCSCKLCVPSIRNRDKTGFCPIESAVMDVDNPYEAIDVIKNKVKEL